MRSYFEKIVGNSAQKARVGSLIDSEHLPHALLLSGSKGTGKLTFAVEIAAAINCENKNSNAPLPCHRCNTCRRISEGKFLDVKIIRRGGERVTFGVDEIRGMIDDIMLSPTESDYKIYIFPEAHTMTAQAQNALLKILEEPPKGGIMILLAEETDKILSTIKSRVQTIALERFDDGLIDEYVTKSSPTGQALKRSDPEGYRDAIASARGSIGEALSLMTPEAIGEAKEKKNFILDVILSFAKKVSFIELKAKLNSLPQSRNELNSTLEDIITALAELIKTRYDTGAVGIFYNDPKEAQRVAALIGNGRLLSIYDLTLAVKEDCSKNANVSALLSGFAAKISML